MVKANHALSNSAQGVCGVVMVACTKRDSREVLETRSKANRMRKVSGGGNGGKRRRETVYSLSLSPQPPRVFRVSVHDSHVTILKLGTGNCHAETVNYGK